MPANKSPRGIFLSLDDEDVERLDYVCMHTDYNRTGLLRRMITSFATRGRWPGFPDIPPMPDRKTGIAIDGPAPEPEPPQEPQP